MRNKVIGLTILGIVLILGLSGCFSHRFEVMHNPDGSGKLTIETIFTEEYLGIFDEGVTMEEAQDDILADSMFSRENLPDDPNIRSVEEKDFIDPTTGELNHSLEIEIFDILTPIYFDDGDESSSIFQVEDYGDGTYLFTASLESMSEFTDEDEDDDFMMDPEMFKFMLQDSKVTWHLHAADFIEGDPYAIYDVMNGIVIWELPMFDVLFAEEPLEIFAIYRVDTAEAAEPEPHEVLMPTPDLDTPDQDIPDPDTPDLDIPDLASPETDIRPPVDFEVDQPSDGLFGLPNWVPIVLVAVLCLGGMFVVIAAVVIFLVVRKQKQNQAEIQNEQDSN